MLCCKTPATACTCKTNASTFDLKSFITLFLVVLLTKSVYGAEEESHQQLKSLSSTNVAASNTAAGVVEEGQHNLKSLSSTNAVSASNVEGSWDLDFKSPSRKILMEDPNYEFETRHLSEDEDHDDHHDQDNKKKKPWLKVIFSCLLVNFATFSGVLLLIPAARFNVFPCCKPEKADDIDSTAADPRVVESRKNLLSLFVPSFACGALLATTFFLILPEAILFIQSQDEHDEHGDEEVSGRRFLSEDEAVADHKDEHNGYEFTPGTIAWFGSSLLAGFIFPFVMGIFFPHNHSHLTNDLADSFENGEATKLRTDEEDEEEADSAVKSNDNQSLSRSSPKTSEDYRLILSILIGDWFHNFCDGIFIGVAFYLCSTGTALTITFITFYHEIAQEIADFFLLTNHGGLSVTKALIFNFASGLSVVVGGLVILLTDVDNFSVGVILAITSGVYLQIAMTECMPRADEHMKTRKDGLVALTSFAAGAIPIGLTLLKHEHCHAH